MLTSVGERFRYVYQVIPRLLRITLDHDQIVAFPAESTQTGLHSAPNY